MSIDSNATAISTEIETVDAIEAPFWAEFFGAALAAATAIYHYFFG